LSWEPRLSRSFSISLRGSWWSFIQSGSVVVVGPEHL
jgi:hypothetical protein